MNFIDPHIHLFDRNLGSYGWLKPSNPPQWPDKAIINRDFDQTDLLATKCQPSGFVHVEAGFDNEQPWREIEWLEATVTMPFKSVACVDLTVSPQSFKALITRYLTLNSVVGVRHIFDDEAVDILAHPNTLINLQCLSQHQLIFETQIAATDTAVVRALSDMANQCSELTIILSHTCFAPLDEHDYYLWLEQVQTLAQQHNIHVKASGWEMVDRQYDMAQVFKVTSALIEAFGEQRVLLASNFPLTLFSQSYQALWHGYQQLSLPVDTKKRLAFDNANRLYKLNL